MLQHWIDSMGGPVPAAIAALAAFNMTLTYIKNICDKAKIKEPSWLQKAASIGSTVLGFLTANTTAPAAKPQEPPKA